VQSGSSLFSQPVNVCVDRFAVIKISFFNKAVKPVPYLLKLDRQLWFNVFRNYERRFEHGNGPQNFSIRVSWLRARHYDLFFLYSEKWLC